jgi:hypothetical protein
VCKPNQQNTTQSQEHKEKKLLKINAAGLLKKICGTNRHSSIKNIKINVNGRQSINAKQNSHKMQTKSVTYTKFTLHFRNYALKIMAYI